MSIQAEELTCDFCNAENPKWRYASDDLDRVSCYTCHECIETGSWDVLAVHILAQPGRAAVVKRIGAKKALELILESLYEFRDQPHHQPKLAVIANQK